ncbi:hypothetical protein SAMN04487895_10913 [Paenibacillus sophorae]|uniref:CPBP family intramembrane metalloprotease n=1 Tax=Paenibacillus sophorae TaxID=1333845 RepID=A0A1H8QW48_9BACL|nr:CPBP family intramembrane glutamic endopeptidase [Paenibacillus sophorae]QWU14843.1 CPBP family intramembrane metalloprotease [Paenibacillus sophorae]SEO57963.1 hypothetical protein SAMN04487895_10913 [Paenibacillus sophorae]
MERGIHKGKLRGTAFFILLIVIMLVMQQAVNYLSYDYRGPSGYALRMLSKVGYAEPFARMLLWYGVQIGITFVLIKLFLSRPLHELGFNWKNVRAGLRLIGIFLILYPLAYLSLRGLLVYEGIYSPTGELQHQSTAYIITDLLTYGMLPGIGEEPFFRIFVIEYLAVYVFAGLRDRKMKWLLATVSSLLFSLGHVFVFWSPFSLQYNGVQLIHAFLLGYWYCYMYFKTESIAAPVICHNYSDFVYRLASWMLG